VLNAANEVTVASFLAGEIPLPRICEINGRVLDAHLAERSGAVVKSLEDVLEADSWARERAHSELCRASRGEKARAAAR
jgi:1-deoxy-D-xylulose-5-phosphate reductoisomerase